MENENQLNYNLKEYIKFYLKLNNPQFAILINGKWGSGKTFFIKNQIDKWNAESNVSLLEYRENRLKSNDTITLKPIYISLYGISKTTEINDKIKEALNPLLYSKGAKIIKNIFFGVIKTATHINLDTDNDGKDDGKVTFDINSMGLLKGTDDKIKGEKLIIFDDLERCKLKSSEIFGYINEFVEHFNCKVILLSDEKKIMQKSNEEKEAYNEFKEKLIGQTFTIQADIENAINAFIKKSPDSTVYNFLNSSKELIISIFNASKIDNLRILKQSIIDFERFVKQFDSEIIKHNKYNDLLNSLLGHFIIVYLEFKSGNHNLYNFLTYHPSDIQKEEEQKLRIKYSDVLGKFNILNRVYIIHYDLIIDFINDGYSNSVKLNNEIKHNKFFKVTEEADWEKLWNWYELEDPEFDNVYESVLTILKNNEIDSPYILLHVITTLYSLIHDNIVIPYEFDLYDTFKNQFEEILNKNRNKAFSKFTDGSLGKRYLDRESEDFIQLISYANEQIVQHNLQIKDDYLEQVFANINNENIYDLKERLDEPLPDRSNSYTSLPILTTVNGKKLAESLLKLTNQNLDEFFYFLNRRYYPENIYVNGNLEAFNAQDKNCLIQVRDEFAKKATSLPKIKKYKVEDHIKFLNGLIKKLEELESNK